MSQLKILTVHVTLFYLKSYSTAFYFGLHQILLFVFSLFLLVFSLILLVFFSVSMSFLSVSLFHSLVIQPHVSSMLPPICLVRSVPPMKLTFSRSSLSSTLRSLVWGLFRKASWMLVVSWLLLSIGCPCHGLL